jgi:hypothetical protein
MALEEMNSARWVEDCCTQGIYDSSKMGIEAAGTNERTVAGWNILLRANRERFPHPNPNIHKANRSDDGIEMVEFHVDDLDFLHNVAKEMGCTLIGGDLSMRKPESLAKPLMIFGQDESVFNQYLLGNRQWVGPEGQRALLPKTDGLGLMLSAFQSRETGFGLKLKQYTNW